MRLLERKDVGDFRLIEFVGDSTPRYAIIARIVGAQNVGDINVVQNSDTLYAFMRRLEAVSGCDSYHLDLRHE